MRLHAFGMHLHMQHTAADWLLLVDDAEDARGALALLFAHAGFRVTESGDGCDAFEKILLSDHLPFLVVLDLEMPVMTGWEVLGLLRTFERFRRVEVIVHSGHPLAADAVRGDPHARHMKKPCLTSELIAHAQRLAAARLPS